MGVSVDHTPRGQRTRRALVDAATDLFIRKGLFDTRIVDITDAVGISPAAFYRYFETKNDILEEAVVNARDASFEALRPRGDEERSAPAFVRLASANARYVETYELNANVIRMLAQRVATDEEFRNVRREWHPIFVRRLEAGLARMQGDGEIGRDVDVLTVAPALSAMVENVSYVHFVLRGDKQLPVHVERTIHMLWGNVLSIPWNVSELPPGMRRPRRPDAAACLALPATPPTPPTLAPPASRKALATRGQLLRAARAVFERQGYLDARVADIASDAGVAHGTFYNYFESRFDVFCVLAEELSSSMHDAMNASRSPRSDLLDVMRFQVRAAAEFFEANVRMMAVIDQFASIDDEAAAVRLTIRSRFVRLVAGTIAQLQRDRRADRRLDPIATASALVSCFERSMFEWHVLDVPRDRNASPDDLAEVWQRAIRAENP